MSGNDGKLPYLHELTKRKFLVSDKKYGYTTVWDEPGLKNCFVAGGCRPNFVLGVSLKVFLSGSFIDIYLIK